MRTVKRIEGVPSLIPTLFLLASLAASLDARRSLDGFQEIGEGEAEFDPDLSITRMDGNNDVAKWGD